MTDTEAEIEIDLMELADLGQPTKIALEIHRQLRLQFGSVPRRMPLAGIAKAVGIEGILPVEGTSYEGTLVIANGKGAIGIRKGMRSGRHNFTLGHEIGHFLIPTHRGQRQQFLCEPADMTRVRASNFSQRPPLERIEVEANEFSAALLVPNPEFKAERRKLGGGCDVAHIRHLAELFDVSQEVMSQIYVQAADEKIAIITSHKGDVRRVIPQQGFPYLGLKKGVPIPNNALTRAFNQIGQDRISGLREISTDIWLEKRGKVSALYEQVFLQDEGWAMTMLLVEEEYVEEDDDDSDWNRRSAQR